MKKVTAFVISGLLLLSAAACDTAKTNVESPNTTKTNAQAPAQDTAQKTQNDATSEVRRRQLNSDTRSREQRDTVAGSDNERTAGDLKSEVRSKLEANLPASQLAVDAKDGAVTVSGTVPTQQQFNKIEPLAKEINGVKSVTVKATVAPAKPKS
ncbi:BON domain-containing protein [Leptolyngbya sp. FACHB-36]|uniref:BON domain-containing protein n=1 Tax=Leptolyngbya sp. FACHB-36 TaxID=2692808 RepID=UPI00167FE595|nr:BON domain-containing protein [Leptolyngbya sp. FACHB-36]MBD2022282.1 BON domain-containing protein [Leptolyngbya sp. FACHB-36]